MSGPQEQQKQQQQQQAPPPYAFANKSGQQQFGVADGAAAEQQQQQQDGEGFTAGRSLDDRNIRRTFIRKVYLILSIQLFFTFGCVLVVNMVPELRWFAIRNGWLFHVSYAVFLVVYIALVCVAPLRRKFPGNFIALTVFTLAMTFMAAVLAARYSLNSVLVCMGITAAVCLCVTLFAVQTRVDFTMCSGLLFGLSVAVLLFGLACCVTVIVYSQNVLVARILDCVYGGLVAVLLVLFLIFDTQRVVGGRKHDLSEEEYVFGAMQLYIDVVYIFIVLLGFSSE